MRVTPALLERLDSQTRHVVESFQEFLAGDGCFCGQDGTIEMGDGLVMCSACVLINEPVIAWPYVALTQPGHEDLL